MMKKLTISKMNEFPIIETQEQMEIKGGGVPPIGPWIYPIIKAVVDYFTDDDNSDSPYNSGNQINQSGLINVGTIQSGSSSPYQLPPGHVLDSISTYPDGKVTWHTSYKP